MIIEQETIRRVLYKGPKWLYFVRETISWLEYSMVFGLFISILLFIFALFNVCNWNIFFYVFIPSIIIGIVTVNIFDEWLFKKYSYCASLKDLQNAENNPNYIIKKHTEKIE